MQSTEDASKTKLHEAFETWKSMFAFLLIPGSLTLAIINADELQQVGVMLFLNKIDLFEKKIENHFDKFQTFFPQYNGGIIIDYCILFSFSHLDRKEREGCD